MKRIRQAITAKAKRTLARVVIWAVTVVAMSGGLQNCRPVAYAAILHR